jgi:hypothetical protein
MDEMKWFSSAMLGVLAANNLGLAWLWLRSAKLFGQQHSAKETWHVQYQPDRPF